MKLSTLTLAALAASCGLWAAPTLADTVNWVGPDGGHFGAAANWDRGSVPDATSDTVIATTQQLEVFGPDDAVEVKSLTIGGGAGATTLWLMQGGELAAAEGTQLLTNGHLRVVSGSDATFATGWLGGSLSTQPGSMLTMRASRPTDGSYDRLVIDGPLLIGGGSFVLRLDGGSPTPRLGDRYDLIDWQTPLRTLSPLPWGQFDQLVLPTLAAGLAWDTSQFYVDGSLAVAAVPEPASYGLLALGLFGLGWRLQRRGAAATTSA